MHIIYPPAYIYMHIIYPPAIQATSLKPTPFDDGRRVFLGVDSGFGHLVRPVMYGSYHHISNLSAAAAAAGTAGAGLAGPADGSGADAGAAAEFFVCGNICESGDIFTRRHVGDESNEPGPRLLPAGTRPGDVLALHTVGAYG